MFICVYLARYILGWRNVEPRNLTNRQVLISANEMQRKNDVTFPALARQIQVCVEVLNGSFDAAVIGLNVSVNTPV